MSVLRTPQFDDNLSQSFIHVPRPNSRQYSAGSIGSQGSIGSLRDFKHGDRSSLTTPKFDYNYARRPTPVYNNSSSSSLLNNRLKTFSEMKKRKKRKKNNRRRRQRPIDPDNLPPAARAEAFRHKGNTPCYQWNDPDHPNKVVWGQRQGWLAASGPSPGPRTATSNMDRSTNTNKSQPSVIIGGAKPKNDVDWAIYRASFIPSAQDYILFDPWKDKQSGGGRFSNAKPKEYLDWVKYYAKQLPAPGDYELPDKHIKGGRFVESKPKNDVEWSIYRAKSKPGPGQYSMERSSMVVQNIVNKKGAILLGKVKKGNNNTVVPNNFTLFKHTTSHPSGPTSCRTDSSLGKQVKGDQKSAASFSFGARTPAESIFGLPPPKKPKRQRYKKNYQYEKNTTLGYDPYDVKLNCSKSTSSIKSALSSIVPPRKVRHRGMGLGKLSNSFQKQYRVAHRLSEPKHPPKILPTDGFGYEPEHFAAMARVTGGRMIGSK